MKTTLLTLLISFMLSAQSPIMKDKPRPDLKNGKAVSKKASKHQKQISKAVQRANPADKTGRNDVRVLDKKKKTLSEKKSDGDMKANPRYKDGKGDKGLKIGKKIQHEQKANPRYKNGKNNSAQIAGIMRANPNRYISKARQRIAAAKKKLEEQIAGKKLSDNEIKKKRALIAKAEKKLNEFSGFSDRVTRKKSAEQ